MRLDGYVRVSQTRGRVGDSFQSPTAQADRINAWATAFGHHIEILHTELDESGARRDRPKLAEAIRRVEAGESDGIIVARLDRFGRSLLDGLTLINRIREAGGTFVSVADGFDLSTDTGRLVLRIMLSLAEFELDRFRGQWHDAKSRAVARGVHPSATVPFGYQRRSDGRLEPHPVNAPLVTEVFARRAAGDGCSAIGRWLESQGAVTQRGNQSWPLRAVKDIVRNEVYLGVAHAASRTDPALDIRNPDAHEPLTDQRTWDRAQRTGVKRPARGHEPNPIAPLMRCASCRYVMRASRHVRISDQRVTWRFTCKSGHSSAHRCPSPVQITDDGALTGWVEDALRARAPVMRAEAKRGAPGVASLREKAQFAQAAFEEWRDDSELQRRLGMATYVTGLAARQDAWDELLNELSRAEMAADTSVLPDDLLERWQDLPAARRRELLQASIRCVFARRIDDSGGTLASRLHVVWASEAVALPAPGGRGPAPGPFRFDDHDA